MRLIDIFYAPCQNARDPPVTQHYICIAYFHWKSGKTGAGVMYEISGAMHWATALAWEFNIFDLPGKIVKASHYLHIKI